MNFFFINDLMMTSNLRFFANDIVKIWTCEYLYVMEILAYDFVLNVCIYNADVKILMYDDW